MALIGKLEKRFYSSGALNTRTYTVLVVRCLLCGRKEDYAAPTDTGPHSHKYIPMCQCYDNADSIAQHVRILPDD